MNSLAIFVSLANVIINTNANINLAANCWPDKRQQRSSLRFRKNNRKSQPSFSCRHSNAIPSYQKASSTKKNIWIKAGGQSQQGFGSFFFSGLVCSTNIRSAEIIIIFIITKMSQIFLVLFPITSNRISKYFFIYFLLNTFLIILWTWCAFKIHNSPILFFLIYIYIYVYIYMCIGKILYKTEARYRFI